MFELATPQELSLKPDRYVKVCGAVQSGKTESLLQRCLRLLDEGVPPADILLEATNASAAQALRGRLVRAAEALDPQLAAAARDVRVQSARAICLDLLGLEEVRSATGREPRLLNDAEVLFLLEDLKARSVPAATLRSAMATFARNWEGLQDEASWDLDGEAARAYACLAKALERRRAILPPEAAYLAATFLASEQGAALRSSVAYVLCDDYQNMSKAEQACMGLLAGSQLMVAGNAQQTMAVLSAHPWLAGFRDFESEHEGAYVASLADVHAQAPIARFARALTSFGDMPLLASGPGDPAEAALAHPDAPQPAHDASANTALPFSSGVVAVKWGTPEEEEKGLFKYLQALKKGGAIENDRDVVVVVPNARWARMAQAALERRGFATNTLGLKVRIGGDPRVAERCPALLAYTKLSLLVDPADVVAWRSWCGIGHDHLQGAAWVQLEDCAEEAGQDVLTALAALPEDGPEPFEGAHALASAYAEGTALVGKLSKRKGFALMNSIGADKLPEFSNVEQTLAGDEEASFVLQLQREAVFDPQLPEKLNAVRIVEPSSMCGLSAPVVVVVGMVDGFFPGRASFDQEASEEARTARLNSERRAFYSAVGKARNLLVMSYFAKADQQLAEAGHMRIARIKSEHGAKVALLRPSTFLAEGDSQLPAITGGQQLLAALE